ncbi:MAG TPA: ATP-grasp domain-containing protein [Blastocatellia bacterium]|nr:ATP-grasp domain-containing protein [Blastocatellia bacterium]
MARCHPIEYSAASTTFPNESPDVADGFAVANQVAKRLNVPFLVVDVAKTMAGRWVAIECNDAQ